MAGPALGPSPVPGGADGLAARPHFDSGGVPYTPFFIRNAAREIYHPGGLIHSTTAGRTDRLPMSVASNSYVMPADVVSGLGQGNTLAGAKVLESALRIGPYGTHLPKGGGGGGHGIPRPPSPYRFAAPERLERGGDVKRTSILAAGGEYVVNPEHVERLGGGDMRKGHNLLDGFVKTVRAHTIRLMRKLPGPKK